MIRGLSNILQHTHVHSSTLLYAHEHAHALALSLSHGYTQLIYRLLSEFILECAMESYGGNVFALYYTHIRTHARTHAHTRTHTHTHGSIQLISRISSTFMRYFATYVEQTYTYVHGIFRPSFHSTHGGCVCTHYYTHMQTHTHTHPRTNLTHITHKYTRMHTHTHTAQIPNLCTHKVKLHPQFPQKYPDTPCRISG